MSLVKYVMKRDLVTASPNETVESATKLMAERNLGAILLVENEKVCGIFTERDVLNRVVAEKKDPASTQLSSVSTMNPIAVSENTTIKECSQIVRDKNIRHLPVVGADQKPVGMVSSRDFLALIVEQMTAFFEQAKAPEEGEEYRFHYSDPFDFIGVNLEEGEDAPDGSKGAL